MAAAMAATVVGASSAPVAAAEPDTIWPDHLVSRDDGGAEAAYAWPDHLVSRDDGGAEAAYVWPDHLVARDGASRVVTAP